MSTQKKPAAPNLALDGTPPSSVSLDDLDRELDKAMAVIADAIAILGPFDTLDLLKDSVSTHPKAPLILAKLDGAQNYLQST